MKRVEDSRSGEYREGNGLASQVEVEDIKRSALLQSFGDVAGLVIIVLLHNISTDSFHKVPFAKGLDSRCRCGVARGKDRHVVAAPDQFVRQQADDVFDTARRRGSYPGPQGRNQGNSQTLIGIL